MIARFQRPSRHWGALSVAMILVLAVIGLTDAQTSKVTETASMADGGTAGTNSPSHAIDLRVGEDPSPELTGPDTEVRALTVKVLAADGKPLAGAYVEAPYIRLAARRMTDAHGEFVLRFPMLPKEFRQRMSNFSVSASHSNYVRRSVMWSSAGGDVHAGMPESVTIKLEPGHSIGGLVQDERGAPLAGVRVLLSGSGYCGFTMGNDERRTHEYSDVFFIDPQSPAAVTDANGRWSFSRFASDIQQLELTFVRPDGSRETYATTDQHGLNLYPLLSLVELEEQTATVRMADGVTVRGVVSDEDGRPLADVKVKEGYGHANLVSVGEFTTDADGSFERLHRHPRQWIYTAVTPDRATASVVAQVEPGMNGVRIVMPPPRPWRIEVVDPDGQPVPDVEITIDPYRTEAQILDWKGTTDATGIVVWTNAPMETVTFSATSKALAAHRQFKIDPAESGRRVVLDPKGVATIAVHLKAVDAKTHQPVRIDQVGLQYNGDVNFRTVAEPNASEFVAELKLSDVRVGMAPSYKFQLEADGYETLTTRYYDFAIGNQELELALDPAGKSDRLLVRLPDGSPAVDARVWAQPTSEAGILFMNAPGRYYGSRLAQERANESGHVKLPGAPADAPVVITHSNGFFAGMMSDLRGREELALPPYGAVEGRFLVAGKPKGGIQISLNTLMWAPQLGFHLGYTATTDAEGRFTFTQVPAGEYKLYRWKLPNRRDTSGTAITETFQWPLTVRPGQTNTIEYAFTGRPVVGRAEPEPANLLVDWQNDVHTLSLRLPDATSPPRRINREDYATFAAFKKANDASFTSEAQLQAARQARTYGLDFEVDGSFRVDDVPPGTYELRIRVTKPGEGGRRSPFGDEEEIGALVREIIVPEGSEPLDLGTLAVPLREAATLEAVPPVAFTATTLDGKALDLAQFKGTNVLLVFWASWSGRSREQLPALEGLRKQFPDEQRFVIVGINLDLTLESARQAATRLHSPGVQGWLEPEGQARVTAAFDVNQLPCVFLLDSEGRIVGRELEGERLMTIVKRTLAKK
jgi:protocatechuate 3,4-dioxygenase beta subunit/thiol-disulfide isomerase/thioredoxin